MASQTLAPKIKYPFEVKYLAPTSHSWAELGVALVPILGILPQRPVTSQRVTAYSAEGQAWAHPGNRTATAIRAIRKDT